MDYKIGIIEDEMTEAAEAKLSLVVNSNGILSEDSFISYELKKEMGFRELLFSQIENDIINNIVQCLIVDYKLDTMREVLTGIEIVEHFHQVIPEFPVIILTNVPEQGKANEEADPDKVYAKKVFLNPDKEKTKEMVENIIRNIKRYSKKRAVLELEQEQAIDKVMNPSETEEMQKDNEYSVLNDIEKKLSKYKPLRLFTVDEMNMKEINSILELIKEYKELLK